MPNKNNDKQKQKPKKMLDFSIFETRKKIADREKEKNDQLKKILGYK